MSDLTPETLADDFDPNKVSIMSGWLVYDVGEHTCGGYGPESSYAHEPGCGFEPMIPVSELPALLAAAAERDALAAKVERVRALPIGPPSGGYYMVSMRDVRAALDGEARP